MDIVFGLWADGGAYPDHGGHGAGALGSPVLGPHGLLELLETATGLTAPPVRSVVRIAAWEAALGRVAGERFWSASLSVDSWSTARTLLAWRDQLIDAGWDHASAWKSPRLADLAAVEAVSDDVPQGKADRLRSLASEIRVGSRLPLRSVRLIDRRDVLPCGWRRMMDRLESAGVEIGDADPVPRAAGGSALYHLQRWLVGGGEIAGRPDGTVTVATSTSSALASQVVGRWFERAGVGTVLLAQEGDTHALDEGLATAGAPRAGRSRPSPHRGALQVLLLGFRTCWSPFDARALMELLVVPSGPIPQRAARRLAAALEEAPGRGGAEWAGAWSDISAAELEAAEGDPVALRKAHQRVELWREWAEPVLHDPPEGMPTEHAVAVCDRVVRWASSRNPDGTDPLLAATVSLAGDVRRALIALGRPRVSRILLDRIVDQVMDEGESNPLALAEAAPFRTVAHPGAIWGPARAVVWWGFAQTSEATGRPPWTEAERAELRAAGSSLDDPDVAARAVAAGWERAVLNATDRLLIVCHGRDAGRDEAMHPLAHRMAPALDTLASTVRIDDAVLDGGLEMAGQVIDRSPIGRAPAPVALPAWPAPADMAERIAARVESATSFEDLLACPLRWALKHVARLRPGRVRSIPDGSRLLGNLAHALAREIFQPGPPPDPEHAAARVAELIEDLVDRLAAPLRHPEFATRLAEARGRLPVAMAELARCLARNGLVVEATELQVSAAFEDALALRGAVDLVCRDASGEVVIIDLKWTSSARRRVEELRAGTAIQLATYGSMLAGEGPYRAGYFLLNQLQFATLAGSGLIGRQVEGARSLQETWDGIKDSWRALTAVASAGSLVARGVEGHEDYAPAVDVIAREVNCGWCDYASICRVRGLQ